MIDKTITTAMDAIKESLQKDGTVHVCLSRQEEVKLLKYSINEYDIGSGQYAYTGVEVGTDWTVINHDPIDKPN